MKRKQKRPITLIEIMIVILLIGLIGGALAYNMSGSMDQGRAFKTKQNIAKVHDILMMEVANGEDIAQVVREKTVYMQRSYLVKDGATFLKDGWGQPLNIVVNPQGDDIVIESTRLEQWKLKHPQT